MEEKQCTDTQPTLLDIDSSVACSHDKETTEVRLGGGNDPHYDEDELREMADNFRAFLRILREWDEQLESNTV